MTHAERFAYDTITGGVSEATPEDLHEADPGVTVDEYRDALASAWDRWRAEHRAIIENFQHVLDDPSEDFDLIDLADEISEADVTLYRVAS